VGNVPARNLLPSNPQSFRFTIKDGDDEPKGKTVSQYSLCINPMDDNSNMYKLVLHVLDGTKDVCTIIKRPSEIDHALTGLNATTIDNRLCIACTLLTGNALLNPI
jgi:hypothetical protein